ncbi:MAG: hypothetical protein JO142_11285 [Burkholderiales bacterium]|nr:hypothetical protein [Burkholderiales bacterium]
MKREQIINFAIENGLIPQSGPRPSDDIDSIIAFAQSIERWVNGRAVEVCKNAFDQGKSAPDAASWISDLSK